jgi:hypothetical protein
LIWVQKFYYISDFFHTTKLVTDLIKSNRVLGISTQLGEAAVERFVSEGVVCPPKLRQGVFTTAAVDNIDHNPSSTTSKSFFHGTGISIFQHPADENDGVERDVMIYLYSGL